MSIGINKAVKYIERNWHKQLDLKAHPGNDTHSLLRPYSTESSLQMIFLFCNFVFKVVFKMLFINSYRMSREVQVFCPRPLSGFRWLYVFYVKSVYIHSFM